MLKKIYSFFHRHYHARYHGIYHHAKQLFIFDIVLLLLATLMLGTSLWFFFWKPGIANLIELSMSVGGNRIKSGEEVRLTVDYANHSKHLLTDVALALRLPEGFVINRQATPESVFSNNSTFTIPPVPPGGKGQITVTGRLWAMPQHEENIFGTFSYKQEKSEEREQALTSFLLSLPESVLRPRLVIASSTFPSASLPFTYTLQNTGAVAIEEIQLNVTGGNAAFDQPDATTFSLARQETKTITGRLAVPEKTANIVFTITPAALVNNRPIAQTPVQTKITIIAPRVASSARLAEPVAYAEPTQKIPIIVSWRNDSDYSLKAQRLRLATTPGLVDLKTTALENNLKIEGNALIADSSNRTALASGGRGSGDTFTVNFTLLPAFTTANDADSFTLTPIFEGDATEVPGQKFSETGKAIHIPLATEVALKSEVRYYTDEGDQLGRGPLPPTVGEATKYWIFVQFTNTANPLRDATLALVLPPGVEFTGRQSVTIGPELVYNSTSKTVSWHYRLIPARSSAGLYFEVALRPTPNQLGETLTITKDITLTATDDTVGKNFQLTGPSLTNILGPTDRGSTAGATVVAR
ncbi:MAG: hypothetical protein UY79_C0002G0039 [Parcubacteria group bacterium GW2011_GWA2_53_21]|nr:MAG: hypothetical protein UY79_C0002G0039 [Parcubacteria group bacterium GW2011_GWA2_53_21]